MRDSSSLVPLAVQALQAEVENRKTSPVTLESLSQTLMISISSQLEFVKHTRNQFESFEENMDEKLEAILELLKKGGKHNSGDIDPHAEVSTRPRRTNQVCFPDLEPCRSPRTADYGHRNGLVADHGSLVKRVEMPIFQGQNTYGWIAKVERYFRLGGYEDESKLELVSVSLDEAPLSWFNGELVQKPFTSWTEFKQRLIIRYSREKIRDVSQPLCAIKQTGFVEAYVQLFEELSSQVSGIQETQLEGIFIM